MRSKLYLLSWWLKIKQCHQHCPRLVRNICIVAKQATAPGIIYTLPKSKYILSTSHISPGVLRWNWNTFPYPHAYMYMYIRSDPCTLNEVEDYIISTPNIISMAICNGDARYSYKVSYSVGWLYYYLSRCCGLALHTRIWVSHVG